MPDATSIAVSPDGTRLAVGTNHGEAVLLNIATGEREKAYNLTLNEVISVEFSLDGTKLLCHVYEKRRNQIQLVDLGTHATRSIYEGEQLADIITGSAFDPTGSTIAVGDMNPKKLAVFRPA